MQSEKKYKSKKKLLVICPHPVGVAPGQRLKYEQYFDYFEQNNIEVIVSPFMSERFQHIVYKKGYFLEKIFWTVIGYLKRIFTIFSLWQYDAVYIFLWVTPFGPPVFESIFCFLNRKVIYDIDDMVFLAPASNANKFIAKLKGKTKMIYLMKKAKHVIVCTPTLEEISKKYNEKVTDISSTINTDTYKVVNKYVNNGRITIGWSGSHSTSKYLKLLENVFIELKKKYDFEIIAIGDPLFEFPSKLKCDSLPWTEKTEVITLQKFDIGVYPLTLNDPWVLGKSGLKALQYMALGIPTIATAIGANCRVIEDNVSGFLVTDENQWISRISMLIEDASLRKRIGTEARKRVEKLFSVHSNRDTYLNVIKQVIDKGTQ
jgi:glycosyltransferase involved in cell wall biosynthesis